MSLVGLFGLKRVAPAVPAPLVVLGATIVLVGVIGLADEGVAVVGEPSGALFDYGEGVSRVSPG